MNDTKCDNGENHNWYIATSVTAIPWDVRMAERLTEKEEKDRQIIFSTSHTLICFKCQKIIQIESTK